MVKFYKKEEVASRYDEKRFKGQGGRIIHRRENENVIEMLDNDFEGKKILDLGAGTCRYSIEFALRGAEVTAFDISQEMLDKGKEKAEEEGVKDRITFVQGDAKNTDYEDGSFDVVTALRLFHLIDDPEALFHEIKRVTRDEILFDFFNVWSLRLFYNKFMRMNSKLRRKRKFKNLLEKNGFYNIEVKRDFFSPYGLYRFSPDSLPIVYHKLDHVLTNNFPFNRFCSVIYIGGRKS